MVRLAMNERTFPQRVLLAKIGLDGHDRGVKVVARGLRDAGFHVIYSGLWQKADSVAQAAQDEDVDWLGISILNGAHMTLVPQVLRGTAPTRHDAHWRNRRWHHSTSRARETQANGCRRMFWLGRFDRVNRRIPVDQRPEINSLQHEP